MLRIMQSAFCYRRISGILLSLSSALLLSAASATSAGAQSYTFINVADKTQEFFSFSPPQLSNNGTLLFSAGLDTAITGIFTKVPGDSTTTIATLGTEFLQFGGSFASINASGVVAFQGNNQLLNPSQGIYSGTGGPLTPVAQNSVVYPPSNLEFSEFGTGGVEAINDAGIIAFYAIRHASAGGGSGIFTRSSTGIGPITTVADSTSGAFQEISTNIAINGGGSVAFRSLTSAAGRGIFVVAPGGAITTIADDSDGFIGIAEGPSINDDGAVVFLASPFLAVQAVVTGSGGALTTVADTNGAYQSFQFGFSINNSGTVVFDAILDDTRRGIFTGPDPVADKVILVGDTLFGETVTSLQFYDGLNDNGDIAFLYGLDNGVDGVALAVVPEPATSVGLLVAAGAVSLLGRRRNSCGRSVTAARDAWAGALSSRPPG